MSLILTPFSQLLNLLNGVFGSYGIAIIVFAIFVKILLFPLSIKGKKGMIQMNMIQGQMQQIKKQFGKDPERYNQEIQALYIREKVNPLSGCMWSLLPLFILLPLYAVIREPIEHIMGLTEAQIYDLANLLNWDTVAVELQMVTQDAVQKAAEKNQKSGIFSGFGNEMYNQLYLASLIPQEGIILSDGTTVAYMNFHMMGMDLTKIPTWKLWQDFSLQNILSLGLVAISACTGFVFTKITQKTNKLAANQPKNEQVEQTNKVMAITMPIMSIWIGLIMPSIMVVYWITNNLTAMVQELVAGQILKKDYEIAIAASEKRKEEEKEQERLEKEKKIKEIEKCKQEVKGGKNKGKNKNKNKSNAKDKDEAVDKEASREGLRNYARGRAYDPNRYPNPYANESGGNGEKIPQTNTTSLEKGIDLSKTESEPPTQVSGGKAPEYNEMDETTKQLVERGINISAPEVVTDEVDASDKVEQETNSSTQNYSEREIESREITASEDEISDWERQKQAMKQENTENKDNETP